MRGIFSGLGLLLVLAVIGFAAMKQFRVATPAAVAPGAAATSAAPVTRTPDQVRADVDKALAQGAARIDEADK